MLSHHHLLEGILKIQLMLYNKYIDNDFSLCAGVEYLCCFIKIDKPTNQSWNVLKITTAHDVTITMYRVVGSTRRYALTDIICPV